MIREVKKTMDKQEKLQYQRDCLLVEQIVGGNKSHLKKAKSFIKYVQARQQQEPYEDYENILELAFAKAIASGVHQTIKHFRKEGFDLTKEDTL